MTRKVTDEKECYCHTCALEFHYLGVARHRAMHRDREEQCEITYSDGRTFIHHFEATE